MSKTRKAIDMYALESDKPVLNWLLDKYHWSSQWRFVAKCTMVKRGKQSWACNRVYSPTPEGILLYNHRDELTTSAAELRDNHTR